MKYLAPMMVLATLVSMTAGAAKKETKVVYQLDTAASKATWTGRKKMGAHNGTIQFKEGHFDMIKNTMKGGEVVMDMTTITDVDQKDPNDQAKLVGHLKSPDFFDVAKFPTATFKIKSFSDVHNFVPGQPNAEIKGDLTVHGITHEETLKLFFTPTADGFTAKGKFIIDRTTYDIKFHSQKFDVKALGDKLIEDRFDLDLDIVAKKQ